MSRAEMEGADLASQLEALVAQLEQARPPSSVQLEAAQSLARSARALAAGTLTSALRASPEHGGARFSGLAHSIPSKLESLMCALSEQLGRQPSPSEQVVEQWLLLAASQLLQACNSMAVRCNMDRQVQLGSAYAACRCFLSCSPTVAAATAVAAGVGSGSTALRRLVTLYSALLQLAISGMQRVQQLGAAAAEAAAPDGLAACLAAAVDMALQLDRRAVTGSAKGILTSTVARVFHCLAFFPEWRVHADAIAGHGQIPSSAMAWALSHLRALAVGLQLPEARRPAGCSWQAAGWVASLLSSRMLRNARTAWASGADGGSTAAAIATAAQLVHQLPLDALPGSDAAAQLETVALVAALPGHLCSPLCQRPVTLARQSIEQRRLVAAQLLPAVGRLPQLLELLGGEQLTDMSDERLVHSVLVCRAVHCELGLLGYYAQQSCAELISGSSSSSRIMHSAADVALWAHAMSAALRCVPLLRALHSVLQTDTRVTYDRNLAAELAVIVSELPVGPATLALERASTLSAAPPHASGDSARSAAGEALQALWALHTVQCRRVHYAATADSPQFRLGPERVLSAVCVLSDCMSAAAFMQLNASVITPGKPMPPSRQLQALSLAYWQALLACGAHIPLEQLGQQQPALLASLAAMLEWGPRSLAADPVVHQLFKHLWGHAMQDVHPNYSHICLVLRYALCRGNLAVLLASGGYLEQMFEEAGPLAAYLGEDIVEGTGTIIGVLLHTTTEPLLGSEEPASGSTLAIRSGEDAILMERVRACLSAFVLPTSPETLSSVRRTLPSARRLAAAVLDWLRRPSAQQEQQLEAVQAAAARSCAYLRCANLGGGGGPAAGQGKGSQRCSGCHTAWYCGTACSHADWRAGHKRVCKALGAARAAEKAARRQEEQG